MRLILTISFLIACTVASAQYKPDSVSQRKLQSLKERKQYYERIFSVADSSAEISRAKVPPAPERAPIKRNAVKATARKK